LRALNTVPIDTPLRRASSLIVIRSSVIKNVFESAVRSLTTPAARLSSDDGLARLA
jgi:hypothetical protein